MNFGSRLLALQLQLILLSLSHSLLAKNAHAFQPSLSRPEPTLLRRRQLSSFSSTSTAHASTTKNSSNNYALYWDNILLTEHAEQVDAYRMRRKNWSRSKLESTGMCLFDAIAEPDSELLGDKIIKVTVEDTITNKRKPLFHLFARGDVLVLSSADNKSDDRRECLVVDVGTNWMTLGVGPSWAPRGLWEARKDGGVRVRLDRAAPQAPLRAQRMALEQVRRNAAGPVATLLAESFVHAASKNDPKYGEQTLEQAAQKLPPRLAGLQNPSTIQQNLVSAKRSTCFPSNPSQDAAILWALQRTVSLIRGPPGTGKTRVASLLIATAMKGGDRILAVTHSNGAADVLLESLLRMGVPAIRVGRPASVAPHLQHRTVVAMAEKHPEVLMVREKTKDASLNQNERSAAMYQLKRTIGDVQQSITKTAPVIVASCIGAHQLFDTSNNNDDDASSSSFPVVVLDEAAQTTEPALLCAIAAARRARQLIMVGDTKQLPPTILSKDLWDSLGVSPMARMEQAGIEQRTLSIQYRMPSVLLEFPSNYFYKGIVQCATTNKNDDGESSKPSSPPPLGFDWPNGLPLAFISTCDPEVTHEFGGKSNPKEAEIVTKIVANLVAGASGGTQDSNKNSASLNIAVITPYAKQVQEIRSLLSNERFFQDEKDHCATTATTNSIRCRVGTVDSFQGQETDVAIVSCVRSNDFHEMGFLRDPRRLCVALTRAKRGLILVGNPSALKTCRHWAALIESCEERKCLVDASSPAVRRLDNGEKMTTQGEDDDDDMESRILLNNNVNGAALDASLLAIAQDKPGEDHFYGLFSVHHENS